MRWHDTCRTYVDCVSRVSVSSVLLAVEILRKNKKSESGQMSSNTILIGLSIFWCGGEKSVHERHSWECAQCDCSSQNTEDFAAWCKLVLKEIKPLQ